MQILNNIEALIKKHIKNIRPQRPHVFGFSTTMGIILKCTIIGLRPTQRNLIPLQDFKNLIDYC